MLGYIIGHASKDIFNLPHLLIVRLKTKAKIAPLRPYPLHVTGQRMKNWECIKCRKKVPNVVECKKRGSQANEIKSIMSKLAAGTEAWHTPT